MDIPNGIIPVGVIVHGKMLTPWTIGYDDIPAKVIKNDNGVLTVHIDGVNPGTNIEIWEGHTREYEMYKNAYIIKEFTKENNEMTFNDLKAGMRVKFRNGNIGVLIPFKANGFLALVFQPRAKVSIYMEIINRNYIKEDLRSQGADHKLDIMEVYDICPCATSFDGLFDVDTEKPLWRRSEVEEITMEELEKRLGHPIKIVKEHE